MNQGSNCEESIFNLGQTFDIEIVNLTPDTHPIHFHVASMQKIHSYEIDVEKYRQSWYDANGGEATKEGYAKKVTNPDPRLYQKGPIVEPEEEEKVFRDVVSTDPG